MTGEAGEHEIEKDMTFLGLIGLQDPPRPEVPEAISKCHDAGIRIIMITGDGSRTAARHCPADRPGARRRR